MLRAQNFLEFRLLPSAQGIALSPLADDLNIALKPDLVLIGRPKGLSISTAPRAPSMRPDRSVSSPLDAALWEAERNRRFHEREQEILTAAAAAPPAQRSDSRTPSPSTTQDGPKQIPRSRARLAARGAALGRRLR